MNNKNKPDLSFWDIWNMSFGFLGIQFGFALQGGFMSRIFQTLGASQEEIPALWIAAPLTGLIVQPVIGYLSDHTWHPRWGRRRPYFLIGAVLATLALLLMPHSPVLWVAAGSLWVLDASINISMEPFRALVADKLNESQRTYGFVVQTLIIGVGTWIASNLPWLITRLGISNTAPPGVIPMSVKVAFSVGAFVLLFSVLYTVLTTKEYPPESLEAFRIKSKAEKKNFFTNIISNIVHMPPTMRKLGVIQFFSWFAFFTMWSLSTPALTDHVFHAPIPLESSYDMKSQEQKTEFLHANERYQDAANSVGAYFGIYGLSSMAFALLLTFYTSKRRINRKYVHMLALIAGGIGFLIMNIIPSPRWLALSFILIGLAWGSILSMPYAMLSGSIEEKKMGVYMGIFNMFIVIPQIIAAVGGINFTYHLIGEAPIHAMTIAGLSLIIAGLSNFLITEERAVY